ncbi:hypothetical protein PG593_10390 [Riemerella anatipestifer]|nr:hypothetical protein [Riemerella anatipestifer]MDY3536691.1 hypothetical protein [Riemerella anatipestifer]
MAYNFYYREILRPLRQVLEQKTADFTPQEKETYGYYYLMCLMDRIPEQNFRKEEEFMSYLRSIVNEFPVKNKGKICRGDYFYEYSDFQTYVRDELGLQPPNRLFWQRFWLALILGFIVLGIAFTALVGSILALILAIILGKNCEDKARKAGTVLCRRE